MIKNAGGGIATTGGYIAGRKDLVEKCAYRLTTPGLGSEVGATIGMNRQLYMGLFLPLIQSVRHLRVQFTYRHYMKASDMM